MADANAWVVTCWCPACAAAPAETTSAVDMTRIGTGAGAGTGTTEQQWQELRRQRWHACSAAVNVLTAARTAVHLCDLQLHLLCTLVCACECIILRVLKRSQVPCMSLTCSAHNLLSALLGICLLGFCGMVECCWHSVCECNRYVTAWLRVDTALPDRGSRT